MQIIDDLMDIYYSKEPWHKYKLPPDEALKYFLKLYADRNILVCLNDDQRVTSYLEYWLVNNAQLEKIVVYNDFAAYLEDIKSGHVCYISDIFCSRRKDIYTLRRQLLEKIPHCEWIFGERDYKRKKFHLVYRRKHGPGKIDAAPRPDAAVYSDPGREPA